MTRRLLISVRAEDDLREFWLYSFHTWGDMQADRYLDEIEGALRMCAVEPERGRQRDDLRSGVRSMLILRHVAFYTFSDHEVLIHRVLHGSMEPDHHLDEA